MLHLSRQWPFIQSQSTYTRSQIIGWSTLIIGLLAGSTFSAFAKQLGTALSPISLLFIGESMIILFIFLSFGGIRLFDEIHRLKKNDILPLFLIGMLATFGLLLLFTGLHSTTATNVELFSRTETLFLVLLATLFLGERLTRMHLIGGVFIIVGVSTVALRGFTETLTLQSGDMLILSGALVFAIVSAIFKKYASHLPPELVLFCRSATAVLTFFLLSPFIEHPFIEELQSLPVRLIPSLIGFGFLARFVSVLSFYEAVERLPITTISFVLPLGMVLGVLFAHLYLGEPLLPYHLIGGVLILSGIFSMRINGVHATEEHAISIIKQHHRQHL